MNHICLDVCTHVIITFMNDLCARTMYEDVGKETNRVVGISIGYLVHILSCTT